MRKLFIIFALVIFLIFLFAFIFSVFFLQSYKFALIYFIASFFSFYVLRSVFRFSVSSPRVEIKEKNFAISEFSTLSPEDEFKHVLILGPTGAGKTTSFFIPNIIRKTPAPASFLITDPKGEIYEYTSIYFEARDKEIYVLNPLDLSRSHYYNPLEFVREEDEFVEIAKLLLINAARKEDEWINLSTPLLAASLAYASTLDYPENTIPNAIRLIKDYPDDALKNLFSQNETSYKFWLAYENTRPSERTAASIRATITNNLVFYTTKRVETFLSKNEIPLDKIREKEIVIYVQIPESESEKFYPLTAVLYSQLFKFLYFLPEGNKFYCFTDELANIGKIPDLSKYASTIRSRRACIFYGLQSISQLVERYGKSAYDILNNTYTKIVFGGVTDPEALRYFKTIAGERRGVRKSYDNVPKFLRDEFLHEAEIPVITTEELRTIGKEEIYIFFSDRNPVKARRPRIDLSKLRKKKLEPFREPKYIEVKPRFETRDAVKKTHKEQKELKITKDDVLEL